MANSARSPLPRDLADEALEGGELLLDDVLGRLILELELVVELGVRAADENLRPQEHQRLKEHERLPHIVLHARAAERTAGRALDGDRLVLERLVLEPRQPVDGVLQAPRNAVIVFRRDD